jgi:Flp pilus assembly protein TadG
LRQSADLTITATADFSAQDYTGSLRAGPITADGFNRLSVDFAMIAVCKRLHRRLQGFARARGGNVVMTFALASLPVVGAVGAAVDYSRANAVNAAMQAALDSTALMLSRDASKLSDTELQSKADTYFKAVFTRPEARSITVTASYNSSASAVVVNGSADVATSIMGIAGIDSITVKGSSTAKWGMSRLRVALALDNTLSMAQSGKMTALKSATKDLISQLQTAATNPGDVYISIVPFNTDVHAATPVAGNASTVPDWVGWTDWDSWSTNCASDYDSSKSSDRDRAADKCGGSFVKKNNKWRWTVDHTKWNGCVKDRDKSPTAYNVSNAAPSTSLTSSLFPADQSSSCAESLMTQTYDWDALKNKVDAMQPTGSTNTTIGLVHAWQTLTDGSPYSPPPIKNDGIATRKIIIFLTDGENTQDRWSNKSSDIDDRMKTACANAKADNITIFTVLVLEGTESLLKSCASPDDTEPKGPKYFKLTSSSQLATTFNQIGTSLTKLRVAK